MRKEKLLKAGTAVLISKLPEAIKMIADSCEEPAVKSGSLMVRR